MLRAVEGRVRIARPLYFDRTGEHLGTKAIVLEHSAAESMLPHTARRGDDLGDLPIRLAEAAASLHTIPIDDLPASIDRPGSYDAYLSARIDEWRQTDSQPLRARTRSSATSRPGSTPTARPRCRSR